jgi:hypothetical protein
MQLLRSPAQHSTLRRVADSQAERRISGATADLNEQARISDRTGARHLAHDLNLHLCD